MSEVIWCIVLKNLVLGGVVLVIVFFLKVRVNLCNQGWLNVLLLVFDQECFWMDFFGGLDLLVYDKLLNWGIGFNQYYVNILFCLFLCLVMYSGQYIMYIGMIVNLYVLLFLSFNKDLLIFGYIFQNLGYYIVYKGKWYLLDIEDGSGLLYGSYFSWGKVLEFYGFSDYNLIGDVYGLVWQGYIVDCMVVGEVSQWLVCDSQKLDKLWLLVVNFVNFYDIMFFLFGEKQE